GELGVQWREALLARGWVVATPDGRYEVSERGREALAELTPEDFKATGRMLYDCVDWSERRDHFAGPLAVAWLEAMVQRAWLQRAVESRELQLTPTLGDARRVRQWREARGGHWHLAIDTGMNRAGCPWDRVGDLADEVRASPPEGAFTHFHSADLDDGSVERQQHRFLESVRALPERPRFLHAENSPAIERQSPSPWDLARPGVALYGVGRGAGSVMAVEGVASLHARIVERRSVAPGESVSYGATWRATEDRVIATAAAGYADGIRRALGNRGSALVGGRRVPIVGAVTMDMTMLDVTGVDCDVGDVATFLGRQGGAELPIAEVAAAGELSPYEVLVGLRLRAPRRYVES
ncbi:MAG: alanine racemase, partial [Gemmatimonadaceae bacterium]|nr:alanine racemase [Gemmatimonadaceae bacterium]